MFDDARAFVTLMVTKKGRLSCLPSSVTHLIDLVHSAHFFSWVEMRVGYDEHLVTVLYLQQ